MNVNYAVKPSTLQQNCSVTSSSTALRGWAARSSVLSASQCSCRRVNCSSTSSPHTGRRTRSTTAHSAR
ncbi:hypothetical protein PO909_030238 [Leuciscus waleckii]